MLLLTLNGEDIDPSKEWEIFSKDGFTVDVIFNRKQPELEPRRVVNVTEFHWLYDVEENTVALESDIDSCGQTLQIDWLQIVSVNGKVDLTSPYYLPINCP